MKENIIEIKYTDDVLLSLKETKEEFEEEASVVSHKRLELFLFVLRERGNVQPG